MTFMFDRQIGGGDFSNRVGKTFEVRVQNHQVPLRLHAFQELPPTQRAGGSFRLEFLGPPAPQLGQGVFAFHIDTDQYNIFIVPLGPQEGGMMYEAVFA